MDIGCHLSIFMGTAFNFHTNWMPGWHPIAFYGLLWQVYICDDGMEMMKAQVQVYFMWPGNVHIYGYRVPFYGILWPFMAFLHVLGGNVHIYGYRVPFNGILWPFMAFVYVTVACKSWKNKSKCISCKVAMSISMDIGCHFMAFYGFLYYLYTYHGSVIILKVQLEIYMYRVAKSRNIGWQCVCLCI